MADDRSTWMPSSPPTFPAALALAGAAFARLPADPDGLFPLTIARARAERGFTSQAAAILADWAGRRTSAAGATRYPWTIAPWTTSALAGSSRRWRPWRPRDEAVLRDGEKARDFENWFLGPLVSSRRSMSSSACARSAPGRRDRRVPPR